jgi:hypothetical protein
VGAALGRLVVVVACLVALAGCGEHGDGAAGGASASPSGTASVNPHDVRLFVEEGATEEEAACLAAEVTSEPEEGDIAGLVAQFEDAAEVCVEESRRAELTAAVEARLTSEIEEVLGPLREEFARQFGAAGATTEEAECMASALLAVDPEELQLYGTTAKKAKIAVALFQDHAGECATPSRLAVLARAWVMGPQAEALAEAGATPAEVECFVTKIGELDLFLPSPDFNGPTAAGMGATRIVEQMDGCIPEPRVREIVMQVFENYIEGCEKTREDPLAPYDC